MRRREDGALVGDMFDGEGFASGVLRNGRGIAGRRALVVGAGGVGSAIAASLAARGLAALRLHDVSAAAVDGLAARLSAAWPSLRVETGSADPDGCDIVVNATPLGMNDGDPMPMDVARIPSAAYVGEVVMKRETTPFLAAARARGCATQLGVDMLFEMIPSYLAFFGIPAATPERLRSLATISY